MSGKSGIGQVAFFCGKFLALSAVFLFLWWWMVQPAYARFVGWISGGFLSAFAGIPVDSTHVEIDPKGVLSTKIDLVFMVGQDVYPIAVGSIIANIPPYLALVLATPGLGLKRLLKVLAIGLGVLGLGHVLFLVFVFVFSGRIQEAPEVPTAIGLFLMTLPFMLWIALAYWDKVMALFDEPDETAAQ